MTIAKVKIKVITSEVSEELYAKLQSLATKMERSKSFVIRKSIEKYLNEVNNATAN